MNEHRRENVLHHHRERFWPVYASCWQTISTHLPCWQLGCRAQQGKESHSGSEELGATRTQTWQERGHGTAAGEFGAFPSGLSCREHMVRRQTSIYRSQSTRPYQLPGEHPGVWNERTLRTLQVANAPTTAKRMKTVGGGILFR